MKDKFKELTEQGFKPAIYIDKDQFRPLTDYPELKEVASDAHKLGYKVFKDSHDDEMRRSRKLYIFRYGHIPAEVSAMVTRKGGIIVSGIF